MPRVRKRNGRWYFYCCACGCHHHFDDRFEFNGDPERPTVRPAIHVAGMGCHLLLTDGRIQFLDDCTHTLRGKAVDAPELEP